MPTALQMQHCVMLCKKGTYASFHLYGSIVVVETGSYYTLFKKQLFCLPIQGNNKWFEIWIFIKALCLSNNNYL